MTCLIAVLLALFVPRDFPPRPSNATLLFEKGAVTVASLPLAPGDSLLALAPSGAVYGAVMVADTSKAFGMTLWGSDDISGFPGFEDGEEIRLRVYSMGAFWEASYTGLSERTICEELLYRDGCIYVVADLQADVALAIDCGRGGKLCRPCKGKHCKADDFEVPLFAQVSEAYPNPAAGLTRIGIRLPRGQTVKTSVFDVLGRRAHYEESLAAEGFSTRQIPLPEGRGMYVIRVQGDNFIEYRKVLVY